MLGQGIYGGAYSKLLGMLFSLTGPHRVIGQYLNVILGVTNMILAYKILRSAGVPIRIARKCVWMLALFPHSLIFQVFYYEKTLLYFLVAFLLQFYSLVWGEKRYTCSLVYFISISCMCVSFGTDWVSTRLCVHVHVLQPQAKTFLFCPEAYWCLVYLFS